jgi:hypothetical protein
MDYQKMLFAFHVRELSMARLTHQTPKDFTPEQRMAWMQERFPATVQGVVSELSDIALMIDSFKASAS